jgi:MFS family permease
LVEAGVFRHRAYTAGLATIVVLFAGMIGMLLVLTLFLQFGEQFSAIHAGLTIAPFALGTAVGAALGAAVLVPRFGRLVLQLATLVMAGGYLWLHEVIASHGLHTSSFSLALPQILTGVGIGMLIAPLFDFILASVRDDEVGSASGVLNTFQQLAGAIGVAVLGTVFFSTLGHEGFAGAINRCLLVGLATTPVLLALTCLLPAHPRESEQVAVAPSGGAASEQDTREGDRDGEDARTPPACDPGIGADRRASEQAADRLGDRRDRLVAGEAV